MTERKHWIDMLRGICMMAILLDHTEIYVAGQNLIPYSMYVTDALVIFFFLSGYLMYKADGFRFISKLKSIIRSLIIPYLVFTAAISIPKQLIRGEIPDLLSIISHILLGEASWFITTLITAELIFSIILLISRKKLWAVSVVSITIFILTKQCTTLQQTTVWNLGNGSEAVMFLFAGYMLHYFEPRLTILSKPIFIVLSALLLVVVKSHIYSNAIQLTVSPVSKDTFVLFSFNAIASILTMLGVSGKLPYISWLASTGRRSIVYYFLSGGVPMLVGIAMGKIGMTYNGHYTVIVIAFIAVYFITSGLTWLIYHYLPFIIGRR